MRKLVICLLCLVGVTIVIASCNSKPSENSNQDAYNDSIQGTFFGVPFGADKDEVVQKFAENNLKLNSNLSTNEVLSFQSTSGKYAFGGMTWECLNVEMSNGKFCGIVFYNAFRDKAEAMSAGKTLVSTVSSKYNLAQNELEDSTIYLYYEGKSKKEPEREVGISIERYEGQDMTIYYGNFLIYSDGKYSSVSDEL